MIPRWILRNTLFNGFGLIFLGIQISQRGPSFIDLILISGTDIEGGSIYVTGTNLCYMIGSFISGYLYSRVKVTSVTIAVALILTGLMVGVTPWCIHFVTMLLAVSSTSVFASIFETTINTEQMRICKGDSDWAMQFLSFCYSLGGIIGPLIVEPFLTPKDTANVTDDGSFNYTHLPSDAERFPNRSGIVNYENQTLTFEQWPASDREMSNGTDPDGRPTEYPIRYAFLITALIAFVAAVPFFVQCFRSRGKEVNKGESGESKPSSRKLPRKVYVGIIAIASIYYFLFMAIDDSFGQFLSYFVVNQLNWSKEDGALVTALYWASSTCVKLALIFLTSRLQMGTILLASNIGMMTSCLGFALVSQMHVHFMVWVFTALLALSISGVFGGGMSWVDSNLLQMDGKATAALVISSAFGATTMPIPIGVLMKSWTPMAFAYILIGVSCLDFLAIIVLLFITKPFILRKYGPPRPPETNIQCQVSPKEDCTDKANDELLLKAATTGYEEEALKGDETKVFI